jgi:ribonuclease D
MELAPFFDLMNNEQVLKVFHSGRQDIEIIHNLNGTIPHPLFDTQVAAMVLGFGEQVGYMMLVKKILGIEIDKSPQYTDWCQRPLSRNQLDYAIGDVTHLRAVYSQLREQLEASGRASWLREEMQVLTSPATYQMHPENAWKRMKMRVKSKKSLSIMIELAQWREETAQKRDVPRSRIMRDEAIYDIANQAPKDFRALERLRSVSKNFATSDSGKEVLQVVKRGAERDPAELPTVKKSSSLKPEDAAVMEMLRILLKASAARNNVAQKLIANSNDLENIATCNGNCRDIPAMRGWRYELFGRDAEAIKHGQLALTVKNGKVETVPISIVRTQAS